MKNKDFLEALGNVVDKKRIEGKVANKLANYIWAAVLCMNHPAFFDTKLKDYYEMKKPPYL